MCWLFDKWVLLKLSRCGIEVTYCILFSLADFVVRLQGHLKYYLSTCKSNDKKRFLQIFPQIFVNDSIFLTTSRGNGAKYLFYNIRIDYNPHALERYMGSSTYCTPLKRPKRWASMSSVTLRKSVGFCSKLHVSPSMMTRLPL